MAKPVRLGVVGAGSIGLRAPLTHFSQGDLNDRVVLQAVCDPVPGRAKAAAEKYKVPFHSESYADLLANGDCDAVTLCSPIGIHFEQGMKAVKAGKHVHFNKTMTVTKGEADKMIAAAKKARVRLVASPGQMLWPKNRRIKKLLQDGAIGTLAWAATGAGFGTYHEEEGVRTGNDVLTNINPSWYFRKPGGGPLYDMTVYGLHALTGVLGPAKRVTGMSGRLLKAREFRGKMVPCDIDDNTFFILDYGKSVYAFVYGAATGYLCPHFGMANYYGTTGAIEGPNLNGKKIEGGEGFNRLPHWEGSHGKLGEDHVFEDVMQLVDWIRDGVPSIVTAEHARHVIEIFESAYKSAQTGKAVDLTTTFATVPGE